MSDGPDLESLVPDLEALLGEMVISVLGEESTPVLDGRRPAAPTGVSRLVVHDAVADWYLGVEVRASVELVSRLATKLLGVTDPAPDDMLDVIAELGNIAAGNIKTLLRTHGQLSLPSSALLTMPSEHPVGLVRAAAVLLDQVLELAVMPLTRTDATITDARWPGTQANNPLLAHLP
ncbi:MAG TPA: chemotaxis protein CheX [Kineosporiaceae bacterium]|nr:chemotaxis protein CheX [Kineosporiaceae bacterium]